MRFLVLNNENGLGTAKELIINWESVKYIRPSSSTIFFMELNNGSSIKLTVNAGDSSVVIDAINTAIKSRSNSNRVIPIQQKSIGAFSFTSIEYLEGGNFIDDELTVYVGANGTASENGQALLDGYQEAVAKIPSIFTVNTYPCLGVFGSVSNVYDFFLSPGTGGLPFALLTPYNFVIDLGNGAGALNYTFEILSENPSNPGQRGEMRITLNGAPVTNANLGGLSIPCSVFVRSSTTLIVGPGQYDLPSDLIIDDIVSMVSLSGIKTTTISGGNDIIIKAGANNSGALTTYKGFSLTGPSGDGTSSNMYVDSNLPFVTFQDIHVIEGLGSFNATPSPFGFPVATTASSVYINCYAKQGFGRGSGSSCSGYFIECWGTSSFGSEGADISGIFQRCGIAEANSSDSKPYGNQISSMFGQNCNNFSASLFDCIAGANSFAYNALTITNSAVFQNCTSEGGRSFASLAGFNAGTFINCVSTSQTFSYQLPFANTTTNAKYINCVGTSTKNFGYPIDSGAAGLFEGRFINCTSLGNEAFGKSNVAGAPNVTTGLLYNCYANDGFAPVSGSGKIRNSLDNTTFSIINLG